MKNLLDEKILWRIIQRLRRVTTEQDWKANHKGDDTMPEDNRISAELAPANKTTIITKLGEIIDLLPFRVNFTADERRSVPGIGVTREGMIPAFTQEMAAHPELVPSYVDTVDMAKDIALRAALLELVAHANELRESLEDTAQAAGSDILLAFLAFYNNVQQAAKRGVPGVDAILSNLQQFIPRGRRPTTPVTPTP